MTTEIKLIQNKDEKYYRVTVNGKNEYLDFDYSNDIDDETDIRRTAKAAAFDECLNAQRHGKVIITYLSH